MRTTWDAVYDVSLFSSRARSLIRDRANDEPGEHHLSDLPYTGTKAIELYEMDGSHYWLVSTMVSPQRLHDSRAGWKDNPYRHLGTI